SVLVANRVAAVLSRAVGGHLDVAAELLTDPDGRSGPRDTLRRRFTAESAGDLLTAAGLVVEEISGVRVVADLVPGAVLEGQADALLAFELAASTRRPYRDLATPLPSLASNAARTSPRGMAGRASPTCCPACSRRSASPGPTRWASRRVRWPACGGSRSCSWTGWATSRCRSRRRSRRRWRTWRPDGSAPRPS